MPDLVSAASHRIDRMEPDHLAGEAQEAETRVGIDEINMCIDTCIECRVPIAVCTVRIESNVQRAARHIKAVPTSRSSIHQMFGSSGLPILLPAYDEP